MTHYYIRISFMVPFWVLKFSSTWEFSNSAQCLSTYTLKCKLITVWRGKDFTESKILSLNDQRWHLCDMTRLYKNVTWFRHHKNMWKRNSKMNTFFYPNIPKLPILHQRYFNWAVIIDFLMNQNYKSQEKVVLDLMIHSSWIGFI